MGLRNILSGEFDSSSGDAYNDLNHVLADGRPVVIDFTLWTILSNFLVLTISLLLTRLFLVIAALAFALLDTANMDWEVDQLRTVIRNVRQGSDALLNTRTLTPWRYAKGRKGDMKTVAAVSFWKVASIAVVGITVVSPLLLAKIPTVLGRLGSGNDCIGWYTPGWLNLGSQSQIFPILGELASEALTAADKLYDLDGLTAQQIRLGKDDTVTISDKCPSYADPDVCESENGLFVGTQLWITPKDLLVGETGNVRVGLGNTCYKAKQLTKVLSTSDDGNKTYGMMFGEYVANPFTAKVSSYQWQTGLGYSWFSATSLRLPSAEGLPDWAQFPPFFNETIARYFWQPNNTVKHSGDLSFLLFNGAGPYSPPTKDPLYETSPEPSDYWTSILPERWHQSLNIAVPIICNTSYIICTNGEEDCTNVEGNAGYADFVRSYNGSPQTKGFLETLRFDGLSQIATISSFPASVRGSRTLYANVQTSVETLTGRSELLRLQLAARTWLTGSARRAASPNSLFNTTKANLLNYFTTPEQRSMCARTLLPESGKLVMPGNRLLALACVLGGLLILLYLVEFLEPAPLTWRLFGPFIVRWRSYSFPHLHRMLSEKTTGVYWRNAMSEYPTGPPNGEDGSQVGTLRIVRVNTLQNRSITRTGGNGLGYGWKVGAGGLDYSAVNINLDDDDRCSLHRRNRSEKMFLPPDAEEGYFTTVMTADSYRGRDIRGDILPRRKEFKAKKRGHVNVRFKGSSADIGSYKWPHWYRGNGGASFGGIGVGGITGDTTGIHRCDHGSTYGSFHDNMASPVIADPLQEREMEVVQFPWSPMSPVRVRERNNSLDDIPWTPMSPVRFRERDSLDDIGVALSV